MKILYATNRQVLPTLFSPEDRARIAGICEVIEAEPPATADKEFLLGHCRDAEIIVTSWGTVGIDSDVVAAAPNLKMVAHAAGTVKPVVSDALWEKGVRVTSGAGAIANGVAEFCLGWILLAPGRAFHQALRVREGLWKDGLDAFGGAFNIHRQNIGIVGASMVGRRLMALLKNFDCRVLLYDPYCAKEQAAEFGAEKVDNLDDIFSRCKAVSLNAPNTEETRKMIRGRHFAMLPDGAVFINTARGEIVEEQEMIDELRKGKFIAVLDVTDPEPTALDSPLRSLPNVILTPHIAGGIHENRLRIGSLMADEIEAFVAGSPMRYEVTRERLATMA